MALHPARLQSREAVRIVGSVALALAVVSLVGCGQTQGRPEQTTSQIPSTQNAEPAPTDREAALPEGLSLDLSTAAHPPPDWVSPPEGTVVNVKDGSILIPVPAGEFIPARKYAPVPLPAYYMAAHEITNAQYARFVEETGHRPPDEAQRSGYFTVRFLGLDRPAWGEDGPPTHKLDHPVVCVSVEDALAYCQWAGLRVPSDEEWTRAAVGDQEYRDFPWGDEWDATLCRNAVNGAEVGETTCPVWSYPEGQSPFGVFGMAGNVREWITWISTIPDHEGELEYLCAGGSWADIGDLPITFGCRSRKSHEPGFRGSLVGFRVVRDAG
jgi:formylglycine-generating enzyme required for sulfatase activity